MGAFFTTEHHRIPQNTIEYLIFSWHYKTSEKHKPSQSHRSRNINSRVLKELHEQITPILQLIFKKSFDARQTPTYWKHANVAPAFKKGDKHKAVNYRPISLTCICCKLMEHIVTKHLMNHLENNNILYDLQHGFRNSRSCETQLLSFIQELSETDNKNIQTDLVIMDFAKAFDKVHHRRLLCKLQYYDISGQTLNLIKVFLSNRTQTVVIDGKSSPLSLSFLVFHKVLYWALSCFWSTLMTCQTT